VVQDSGKTLCLNALKPLNLPEPVQVEESASGGPAVIKTAHSNSVAQASSPVIKTAHFNSVAQASSPVIKTARGQTVRSVEDRWRIDDEWWRSDPVSRLYYTVRLASGQRLVIYQDLVSGNWYRQMY
jgi:hypothetical protein